jgi:RHS repeat-associated protein
MTTATTSYGEEITGTANDTFKFGQLYRDSDSGLDYAMNRYYASGIGRFLTPDIGRASNADVLPGNWNSYAYVGGDPINKSDPNGLCSPDDNPPCYPVTVTGSVPFWFGGDSGRTDPITANPNADGPANAAQRGAAAPARLRAAGITLAFNALLDPKCQSVFNTNVSAGAKVYSPSGMLLVLGGGGSTSDGRYWGTITQANLGATVDAVTQGQGQSIPITGSSSVYMSSNIVLNNGYSNNWTSWDTAELAGDLIHELGHVFNMTQGLGGSKVVDDANPDGTPNDAKEAQNAATLKPCTDAIAKIQGGPK